MNWFSSLPINSGRIPKVSLAPINFPSVIATKAKAPSIWLKASTKRSITPSFLDRAISCRNTSVSDVDWKIAPLFTNSFLKVRAFVKFPLCAIANPPTERSANKGWTFLRAGSPVVEYLTWPMASWPCILSIVVFFVKWSLTRPMRRSEWKCFPS